MINDGRRRGDDGDDSQADDDDGCMSKRSQATPHSRAWNKLNYKGRGRMDRLAFASQPVRRSRIAPTRRRTDPYNTIIIIIITGPGNFFLLLPLLPSTSFIDDLICKRAVINELDILSQAAVEWFARQSMECGRGHLDWWQNRNVVDLRI